MIIDKQKLQKLLWAEVASWKADCGEWKQNAEALGEFLGEKTVEEVALELLAENERLGHLEAAFAEWIEKTDWVQASVQALELGRHRADVLRSRIDQLKADNETWRLSIEAERRVHKATVKGLQDELDRLKGPSFAEELATLRKESEQYQWLREGRSGHIEVVEWIGPHATGMIGEDLDALVDAAMVQGERS